MKKDINFHYSKGWYYCYNEDALAVQKLTGYQTFETSRGIAVSFPYEKLGYVTQLLREQENINMIEMFKGSFIIKMIGGKQYCYVIGTDIERNSPFVSYVYYHKENEVLEYNNKKFMIIQKNMEVVKVNNKASKA